MLRYFYDSVKLRTEELAELTENSGKEDEDLVNPNDAFSHQEKQFLEYAPFFLSTFLQDTFLQCC